MVQQTNYVYIIDALCARQVINFGFKIPKEPVKAFLGARKLKHKYSMTQNYDRCRVAYAAVSRITPFTPHKFMKVLRQNAKALGRKII